MITLYTGNTPNGRKASIMLEEIGLPYRIRPIGEDARREPAAFTAMVDEADAGEPRIPFETVAALIHLAERARMLLSPDGPRRAAQLGWLFWGAAGLAPALGGREDEAVRLLKVMEKRLRDAEHLAGDYSIADIEAFAWIDALIAPLRERAGDRLGPTPSIDRWLAALNARPAVRRGLKRPEL